LFHICFREIAEARTGASEISLQPLSFFAQHDWILDQDQVFILDQLHLSAWSWRFCCSTLFPGRTP